MEKARIKVNSNKVLFSVWFLWVISLAPWLLPLIYGISENDSLAVIVCFFSLVSLGSIFLFINALYMIQYAEISERGITIYSLFSIIKEINKNGVTILLIEHDMKFVSGLCDEITVLNFGTVLAQGTPEVALNDPEVVKAYIGG